MIVEEVCYSFIWYLLTAWVGDRTKWTCENFKCTKSDTDHIITITLMYRVRTSSIRLKRFV